ncbi:hypothetical protein LO772_28610 [Yinghuangia sp. ASG 101]|uniref:hypothetical protein n=1 Tax=Yinghuangia sp. ASG 101 TaxID=2896848 RepID=UPI001E304B66|nr:hypothetical protein [Yinghuangia sp. ASG 101]UGQ10750.1 hypothetical protein LO772_28610 [Yinghuangia sp. ASG 101]
MYELSRVRLFSIGPAGARYADTVLDLRGVGEPVPDPAPRQAQLFEGEPVGPPRRPAPAGVLFLENGGGKSVLLKLIFSVMLPGHRNTLGGASSGVLRKFLLADDCGHVALEWQHTQTGELVVVGKVSEWRGRQVSSDPRKFAEGWYSFRPGPGLTLDDLPVVSSGRRRTMRGFRDALAETAKLHPDVDVVWEEIHERWNDHLGHLGLDPELFRYQREMNADEGEAAGLFAVKNDADFVDLLLRAVTDTADTDGLADLVDGFAAKLSQRAELTAERDFVDGATGLLHALADASDQRTRVRAAHRAAEDEARALGRDLAARAGRERDRAGELSEQVATAADEVDTAERALAHAALVTAEITHRNAGMRLAAAEADGTALKRELTEARGTHAAWLATEAVLRHRSAVDRAERVAAAIQAAERDAAPALAARQSAASALVRALNAAAAVAAERADEEEQRAADLQARGEAAQRAATVAATESQRTRSEAVHLRARLGEVGSELGQAVEAGWIAEDDDPAEAAHRAATEEKAAAAAWNEARAAVEHATAAVRDAESERGRAELAAARAADRLASAEQELQGVRTSARALLDEPRAGELLSLDGEFDASRSPRGGAHGPGARDSQARGAQGARSAADDGPPHAAEPADSAAVLDRAADILAGLLDDAIADNERALFHLRTEAADDSRILAALGDGGLLPAGPDVLAAVELLGEHGIPALPGWRYLAQSVPAERHTAVLHAHADLVDGVVVTAANEMPRAREVLAEAALLPRSAVTVGTPEALLADRAEEPSADAVFLVPPNPAMHDERAADTERQALRRRATDRDDAIRVRAARLDGDRALAGRLAAWRAICPAGRVDELTAALSAATDALVEARAAGTDAEAAATTAEIARARAVEQRDRRMDAAQLARRRADTLAGLAFRLRERAGWTRRIRELDQETGEHDAAAEANLTLARAADQDRRQAQRAADDARRTARALLEERAEISGTVRMPAADPAEDRPDDREPREAPGALPALREAYRTASVLYDKVGVGADLRAEQARAESEQAAAQAALDRLSARVRKHAAELLTGPDGADGPARLAAAGRAEEHVRTLEGRTDAANELLGRLRGEVERHAPGDGRDAHTDLPEDRVPRDPAHARELLRRAAAEHASLAERRQAARDTHARLVRSLSDAESGAAAFAEISASLTDTLPSVEPSAAEETPEPFDGTPAEARDAATTRRRALRAAAAELSTAEARVREHAEAVVRHAGAARFEQVRMPARQQIRELPLSALPEHALAWASAFEPRLRVLTDELAQIERNRDSIVDRLRGMVDASLTTLRAAQRLSRLPDELGEWSGQEFLRIRFDDPDAAHLSERLGAVVDEATRNARRAGGGPAPVRRDGTTLLLRAVHAGLEPRGVQVEILKPDSVLRAERVPVGQMGDVFSGGQLLTAAIGLYCTMAALRSNDRGRAKHRHAGTLFLDNPIGRANASYLLELQRAVADALGVQLIYTTGLFDTTALAEFPLVVRLRNDADLRAGLKYISVEEHLRPGLPQPDPEIPDGLGRIHATRVFRKPPDAPEPAATLAPQPRPKDAPGVSVP